MASLPPEVRASYVVIIDGILAQSDLQTVTSKRIREGLQQQVDYDITPQKNEIKTLIMERFDKFAAERDAVPTANGKTDSAPPPAPDSHSDSYPTVASATAPHRTSHKRPSDDDEVDDVKPSGLTGYGRDDSVASKPTPPPKKKRKPEAVEDDAAFAARLQAEENLRARPTRNGVTGRKAAPTKKGKKSAAPKRKTAARVGADDDSDLEVSSGEGPTERKVNRNTGFHKYLALSPALSALLDGETQMSRPQTVKRIWDYVKARDLQDPKDKRIIRCDDALRAVFKQDKVHMFTMNKILATQMYDPES